MFPDARFGAFEAHYVPALERFPAPSSSGRAASSACRPFRPLLSYNFAVAGRLWQPSFVIAANGFADGPAQALRDYLVPAEPRS